MTDAVEKVFVRGACGVCETGDVFFSCFQGQQLVLGGQKQTDTGRPNSRLSQLGRWSEQAQGHGLEILNDGGEMELVARAGKATQSHAFESVMRLQMRKAHLDPLPFIARLQERLSAVSTCETESAD